jgi:glucokinase
MHAAWEGFQLRENAERELTKALGRELRVTYENDCNAAALWEAHVNDPEGAEVVALLAPGTGLGGGIVINSHLVRGYRGMGGELGHVEIVHEWFNKGEPTPRCGCGQSFCAEAYASMAALMKILPGALKQEKYKDHPLNKIEAGPGEDVWRKRAFGVRGLAAKGDELCQAIFDWQCVAIAKLARQVAVAVDPTRIIIGGGFIEGGPVLTERVMNKIREHFKPLAFKKHAAEVKIESAKAGDQAGCLGAALSAWQYAHKTY